MQTRWIDSPGPFTCPTAVLWRRAAGNRRKVVGIALGISLASAALLASASSARAWNIETVDYGNVGTHSSLKVGSGDQIHISYADGGQGHLKYALYNGTSWAIETVDPQYLNGICTSLALDSSGNPHIAYIFYSGHSIRYASKAGSQWTISEFDGGSDYEMYPSLALDSHDRPHIAYWDDEYGANNLSYATYDGSSWTSTTLDSQGSVGRAPSLAIDSADHPHIVYYDETNSLLKYAWFDGTQWTIEVIDSVELVAFNFRTAIAIDSQGRIHAVYSAYHYVAPNWCGRLRYAMHDETGWHVSTVTQAAPTRDYRIPAIAIDSQDRPHISFLLYYNSESYSPELTYAWFDGTGWPQQIISYDCPDSGNSNSIGLDSQGNPHVSFIFGSYSLQHAVGVNPAAVQTGVFGAPDGVDLLPVFPNPLHGRGEVHFVLPHAGNADLTLFDASGRSLRTLAHGRYEAGEHAVELGLDPKLPIGVYLLRLQAGERNVTRKVAIR